jgi:hypothetical protein
MTTREAFDSNGYNQTVFGNRFAEMLQSNLCMGKIEISAPPSGKMVVIAVVSPQQVHKLAINYMTHPIHPADAVCFDLREVRRRCPAYDGASTSIGAARPQQSTL